ncbi:MAG: MarR family transcriptional regulator [Nocardioides sp.]
MAASDGRKTTRKRVPAAQVETVLAGTRAVGAIIAESLASVEEVVSMPQLRVLIMTSQQQQSMSSIAEDLGVHASNATRTCERLVRAGLLDRTTDTEDRRRVVLSLTPEGERLLAQVMDRRRKRVVSIMEQMTADDRAALASSLAAFTELAGTEPHGPHPVAARHA